MKWSPEQDRALSAVANWMHAGDPGQQVFRLFGFAGAGKTTLAHHFAQGVERPVLFAAFTGKAASVMRRRGCPDATTIHKLIYHARDRSRKRLLELEQKLAAQSNRNSLVGFRLRKAIEKERVLMAQPSFSLNEESTVRDANLVIIDECSMVGGRMGQDLLSFGTKVLVLGDPGQLPPVADGGFFTNQKPDFMLTEIHRQAAESPVLKLATMIRQGETLETGDYGPADDAINTARVLHRKDLEPRLVMMTDQLIVGRNKTRRASNKRVRNLMGLGDSPLPGEGDRLVCLRNDHELGLLNGTIWEVVEVDQTNGDSMIFTIKSMDDGYTLTVEAHTHYFQGREDELKQDWYIRKECQEFDYGYALTCHKAQGSQWGHVMVLDESRVFRKDSQRWLYTAVTRAEFAVDVVVGM